MRVAMLTWVQVAGDKSVLYHNAGSTATDPPAPYSTPQGNAPSVFLRVAPPKNSQNAEPKSRCSSPTTRLQELLVSTTSRMTPHALAPHTTDTGHKALCPVS